MCPFNRNRSWSLKAKHSVFKKTRSFEAKIHAVDCRSTAKIVHKGIETGSELVQLGR
jgi:hypothetical protein